MYRARHTICLLIAPWLDFVMGVQFQTDSMQLAGDLMQDLAAYLNVGDLGVS